MLWRAQEQGIAPVDVVVGNLYPFSRVALQSSDYDECIENIDIGGPSLLRAAAKNHDNVLVVVDPSDYERVAEHLQESRYGPLASYVTYPSPIAAILLSAARGR